LAVGAGFRLVEYFLRPALSVDEATLALNVAVRSYRGLLTGLDYAQVAPLLFLWAERFGTRVLGANEFGLRAVPLLSGLALLIAVWKMTRPLVGPREAILCTWFAACSPTLIRYSVVAKPYETDALVTTVLIGYAARAIVVAESPAPWRQLIVAGAVAIFASIPAPLVLAGIGVAVVVGTGRVAWYAAFPRRLLAAGVVWGGLFAACYIAFYAAQAHSAFMQQFWEATFLSPQSHAVLRHAWVAAREAIFVAAVGNTLPTVSTVLVLALAGVGIGALARRHGAWLAVLVGGPVAFAIAASVFRRYPLSERLMVFAAPLVLLMLASGLGRVADRLSPVKRWVFPGAATIWLVVMAVITVTKPRFAPPSRPLILEIQGQRTASEPVYVYATGAPVWLFYTTDWASPDTARLRWLAPVLGPDGPAFGNASGRGHAVRDQGRDLNFVYQGTPIVLGISTGMQIRMVTGLTQEAPDSGWAANEAARIRDAAHPEAWVYFEGFFNEHPVTELRDALARTGGREVRGHKRRGVHVFEYHFD